MGDYLRKFPYCRPQGTRLVYFTPSTSAIVPGLSFSRSYPDSRVFLQLPRFSSHLKIDLQLKYIWLRCCAPRSYMDSIVAATSTPYMFSTWSHRAAPYATQPLERFQEFCFFLVSPRLVKEDKLQAHPRSRENKFQVHLPKAIYRFFIPPFPPLLFKS